MSQETKTTDATAKTASEQQVATSPQTVKKSRKVMYTTREVAKILGVNEKTIRNWRTEELNGIRILPADWRDHHGVYYYFKERIDQLATVFRKDWRTAWANPYPDESTESTVPPSAPNTKKTEETSNFDGYDPGPNGLCNVEMEKFVLSAMLLKDGEIVPQMATMLTADDFYRPEHRLMFNAILRLQEKKIIPNMLSFINELRLSGDIEKTGIDYPFALMEIAHTTAYAPYYAKNIKEQAERRRLTYLAEKIVSDAQEGLKSPLDIIADTSNAFTSFADPKKYDFSPVGEYISQEFFKNIEENKQFADRKTGFSNIDSLQIFKPGLYVLGATPGCGKTTFCWQLLSQLAEKDEKCIFCSYEMSKGELIAKTFSRKLFLHDKKNALTAAQILRGERTDYLETIAKEELKTENLLVRKFTNENVDKLLAILRPLCTNAERPPIVCIDYLQRLIPRDGKADTRALIDSALSKLKDFSEETKTTFIVVSTFNRVNYNQTVDFEAFKESGGIEYTADVVWAMQLYAVNSLFGENPNESRKKIHEAQKEQPRKIQLKCLKSRNNNIYDCYFEYFSAHDFFNPCSRFTFDQAKVSDNLDKNNTKDSF